MKRSTGKGYKDYDYEHDILFFRIQGRDYDYSLEFDGFKNLGKEGHPIGIELFSASKLFKLPKYALKSIKGFEFHAVAENGILTIQLRFTSILRNKEVVRQGHDFVREAADVTEGESVATA